ncbi:MAG: recombinase zinc beta ribbon domain-containing protein, partial [Clostridia bacterium]|nr:recombinase zinc beta ribbon domain-containing protein [Clostridia bacterium]
CRIISDIASFDGIHGVQLYGKAKHETDDMSDMKIIVMPHTGVVCSDIWLACQKKISKNRQIGNSVSNTTSWLGGKVFCKKCGRSMRAARGNFRTDGSYTRYFGCTGKSHNRICDGVKIPVYADSLEAMADDLIAQKLSALKDIRRCIQNGNSSKVNQMKNRISEIKADQKKLVEILLHDTVEPDMLDLLNARAEELSEEKRALSEKIAELEQGDAGETDGICLTDKWKNASYAEKKATAGLLIDRICIEEDGTTEIVWNI